MRAWQVRKRGEPADVLERVDLEPPAPGPGQATVRVAAAGLGLPDVLMCRGVYPLTPALPFVCGQEVTGTVTAVGDGVELAVGTKVMGVTVFTEGWGGFADECLVFPNSTFPVPAGLSDEEAAGFWIPHMTAWIGLVDRGGLQPEDELVVLGAGGGSGAAAIQLGKALRARVIAVVGDDARAELCRSLGADAVIDHRAGPLGDAILAATGGRGADVVYDPVGGDAGEAAARALARYGRLLAIGFASGRWPQVPVHELVVSNTSIVGVLAGGYSRAELEGVHARLSGLIASEALRTTVTEAVPFDDLPRALQRVADRAVVGKVVMVAAPSARVDQS
jgi:NADPH2:quinone reductase